MRNSKFAKAGHFTEVNLPKAAAGQLASKSLERTGKVKPKRNASKTSRKPSVY
jgi:hypothetical protein